MACVPHRSCMVMTLDNSSHGPAPITLLLQTPPVFFLSKTSYSPARTLPAPISPPKSSILSLHCTKAFQKPFRIKSKPKMFKAMSQFGLEQRST